MNTRRLLGPVAVAALLALNTGLWSLFPPLDHGRSAGFERQFASEFVASNVVLLFACTLVLATRWKRIEPFFGGLDRMYLWHRTLAIVAILLATLHFALTPLDTANVKPGTPMGLVAYFGILVMILMALAPRLPVLRWLIRLSYGSWRLTHKLIGFFFFTGFVHMMLVDPLIRTSAVSFTLACLAFAAGTVSWVYALIFAPFLRTRRVCTVIGVNSITDEVVEIVLKPRRDALPFHAGQFVFLKFKGVWRLGEPHPFTISSAPHDGEIKLTIKAGGDFTSRLQTRVKPGMQAVIEGAYGLFDYSKGLPQQVWIAAGVGITPFLSWLRDLDAPLDRDIDLFYSVRHTDDALFAEELARYAARHARFNLHIHATSEKGRLDIDTMRTAAPDLKTRGIYMCGPAPMTASLSVALRRTGTPAGNIHYELFNFR